MNRHIMWRAVCLAVVGALFAAVAVHAQPSSEVLKEIDRQRYQGQYDEAMATLEELQEKYPDNAEVLWRLSRVRVNRANTEYVGEEQNEAYRQAMREARAAVKADPESDETHLSLAIVAGRVALISGTQRKVELSRAVKEHADRAIALNPKNDLAYHVRGRWNYEIADLGWLTRNVVRAVYGGLPDASYQKAASDFEKAVEIADRISHRVQLGKAYLKMDRRDEARVQLEKALSMPNQLADDADYKQEARELLEDEF